VNERAEDKPPLQDPWAGRPLPERSAPRRLGGIIALLAALVVLLGGYALYEKLRPPPASIVTVKPSPNLLLAIRDISRLETTELHFEKVIDLTDKQSRFYGLVEGTDAILLVAVGRVTIGVDLSKVTADDISFDPESKAARLRLPAPEILSSSLDEKKTYVYTRDTSLLAKRNESLETRARQEAVAAIEKAAREADVTSRAKAQAEKQLTLLVTELGASRVEISWR
jgi:hypothetical protein